SYSKLLDEPPPEALRRAVLAGNAAIHERGEMNRDFTRMGTTCTTLALTSEGAVMAHVGDSRAYRVRGNVIEQLTFDHSLQWELLRQGRIPAEEIFRNEPRNVITRSLGPGAQVEVDVEGPYKIEPFDTYVLCSDGLSGLVSDPEMGAIVRTLPPGDACRMLVNLANLRGGPDNITVLVVRVGEIPDGVGGQSSWDQPVFESRDGSTQFGWPWLLAWFVVGLMFVAGLGLVFTERPVAGNILMALANLGCGGLILFWLRQRRLTTARELYPELTPGTPYRTATAELTPGFVNELASLATALQRTALDDGWSIDWPQFESAYSAGKTHLASKQFVDAFRSYAKALQVLMEGVHQVRRQRDHVLKWGARAAPDE
ncbi:MAG: serine/threonine-protein phosphatase, partial [Planctomycetaceae bacterium]